MVAAARRRGGSRTGASPWRLHRQPRRRAARAPLPLPPPFAPAPERLEDVRYTEEQIRRVEESIRICREAEPVELVQAVKKLRKVFARVEKRRKELPLELKLKVPYDIVGRLHDLGDNNSVIQQRDIIRGRGRATRRASYNTGIWSAHYMLSGDDEQQIAAIPDLNPFVPVHSGEEEEVVVTQNAPGR